MKFIANLFIKLGILKRDFDYHLIRASMVVIFLFFGYQKWFNYEAQALIPYIGHGPLIFGCIRDLVIPHCTYTDPEVAIVGLTPARAAEQGIVLETHGLELAKV